MNQAEKLQISGAVSIRGYNASGEEVLAIDKQNLVVTTGKQRMAQLLATGNGDLLVDGIAFGTGAGAPTLSDNIGSILDPFQKAMGTTPTYPAANSVQFPWTLEFSEYNGNTIREIGLLSGLGSGDDALFSRIVTEPIAKNSGLRLVGTWTITF